MSRDNQRLNAQITFGSVLDASFRRNTGLIRHGLDRVSNAIGDVTREQKALGRERDVLRRAGQSVEHLDRQYNELGETLEELTRRRERWDRAAVASNRVGASWNRTTTAFASDSRRAALGVGAVVAAIGGVTHSAAEAAREVRNLSNVSNMDSREFQRWAAGAATVGIESDKLSDILKDMNDRVGDFRQTGAGPLVDFFEQIGPKIGVTIRDFENLSGADALQLYVSSLERANLSQADFTFYMEAIASDSTLLLPLLRDNGAAMRELGDRAERAGQIFSEADIQRAIEYQRALADVQGSFRGVTRTVGLAFMPVVSDAMGKVSDLVIENREEIKAWAEGAATWTRDALPGLLDFADGVGTITAGVMGVTAATADLVGGWDNLGMIMAGGMFARSAVAAGQLGVNVFRLGRAAVGLTGVLPWLSGMLPALSGGFAALGSAILATPVGWLLAGAAAIAGAGVLIYRNWDKVGPFLGDTLSDLKDGVFGLGEAALGMVTGDWSKAGRGLAKVWKGASGIAKRNFAVIGGAAEWLHEKAIGPLLERMGLTEPVSKAWAFTGRHMRGVFGDIKRGGLGLFNALSGLVTGDMPRAANGLSEVWEASKSRVRRAWDLMGSGVSWTYQNVIKPVTDSLGVTDTIETAWTGASDWVKSKWADMGAAISQKWKDDILPAIEGIANTDSIGTAWEATKDALGISVPAIGDIFDRSLPLVKPLVELLRWTVDNGALAAMTIRRAFDNENWEENAFNDRALHGSGKPEWMTDEQWLRVQSWDTRPVNAPDTPPASGANAPGIVPPRLPAGTQPRAKGGAYRPGWLLTGEKGPELRFENRAGYIADRNALQELADFARVANDAPALGRSASLGSSPAVASPGAPANLPAGVLAFERPRPPVEEAETPDWFAAALGRPASLGLSPAVASPGAPANLPAGVLAFELPRPPVEEVETPDWFAAAMAAERSVPARPAEQSQPAAAAQPAAAPTIVQNFHYQINAANFTAEDLVRELERKERQAAAGALYDRMGY